MASTRIKGTQATLLDVFNAEASGQPLTADVEEVVNYVCAMETGFQRPLLPPLLQAALVHYQFETIHPFLDGNVRLGRLLIVFFLVVRDRLPEPLLYLSPYFDAHVSELLQRPARRPRAR